MVSTNGSSDVEQEIATIRCLVAQQLYAIDRDRNGPGRPAVDALLQRLLRRDEDLRRDLKDVRFGAPIR